jgi:chaperonin GroEL
VGRRETDDSNFSGIIVSIKRTILSTEITKDQIRDKVQSGIDQVVDLVRVTTGPRGGNVLVDRGFGTPIEANDAATIIKSIILKDKFENMGVEIIKDIIARLKDGRSAAVILAQALLREGNKLIAQGWNGSMMRKGINAAGADIIDALKAVSVPITNDQEIENVASISSESKEYGKLIADTLKKLGNDGIITVEESELFDVDAKITDGLEFDRGYISPWMVTDPEQMVADCTDAPILITDKKLTDARLLFPILQKVSKAGHTHMVIIAEDIDGEALNMIIRSKLTPGGLQVVGIKLPGFGDMKKEMMGDLALVVGATLVNDTLGVTMDKLEINVLGGAHRVLVTKETTTIVDGLGDKEKITERVNQIKIQISQTQDGFKIQNFEKRIANIVGKVAVINVGANTETVRNHTKLKIEDAVAATKKAIKNGIISGGGVALIKAKSQIKRDLLKETPEFVIGYNLVLNVLHEPFKQIVVNATESHRRWYDFSDKITPMINRILNSNNNVGFDAENNIQVDDMIQAGVIDSLEIAQDGVKFATEAIGMLLTSRGATLQHKD